MPELADVFRRFGGSYLEAHGAAMLPSHRRAIADIIACRTETLGGQLWCCNNCGTLLHVFHSCLMGEIRNGESAGGRRLIRCSFNRLSFGCASLALH